MANVNGRKDPNCWVCHKEGSQFFCPKCSHGFHIGCALDTKEDFDQRDETFNGMCNQCSRIKRSRHLYASSQKFKSISKDKLNSLFDFLLIRGGEIGPPPSIMRAVQGVEVLNKIKRFINFDTIRSKIHLKKYECTEELLLDLRKIEHIMVLNFKESHQSREIGRYIRQVSRYFYEIDLCPHCIYNHYLTRLGSASTCPWGHKLAVAYQSKEYSPSFGILNSAGYPDLPPFFPVKIVACDFDCVYVRLFDMRKPWSSKIPLKNVKHLTNHSLKQFSSFLLNSEFMFSKQHFQNAFDKLQIHLKVLKQRFGNHFSLIFDHNRVWKSNDELFIDCQSNAIDESERRSSPNTSKDSEFNETGCRENQVTNELSGSIANNKRSLETDSTNSPKRLTRQEIQIATNPRTGLRDSTSEPLPNGWLAKIAPHGRIYYIEESTNTISWIDPRTRKPDSALTCKNSSTSDSILKQLLNGQTKNDQEGCQPSEPVRSGDHPSLNVVYQKILDTKLGTSQTSPKYSIETSDLIIPEEIRPSEEVDEVVENLPNNSALSSLVDGIVRSPSSLSTSEKLDISERKRINGLESDERKSKKLESQANGEQSLTHGKTESAKDVELGIKNNSMVSESKFAQVIHQKVLPCSRCHTLEKKFKEYEQAIVLHKIRCEALIENYYNLEKASLQLS